MALYSKMLVRKPTRFSDDALEQNIRNVIEQKTNKTGQHYSGTPHLHSSKFNALDVGSEVQRQSRKYIPYNLFSGFLYFFLMFHS